MLIDACAFSVHFISVAHFLTFFMQFQESLAGTCQVSLVVELQVLELSDELLQALNVTALGSLS